MKKEVLVRKMEELDCPEIEPSCHKRYLKMALLSSGRYKQRTFIEAFSLNKVFKELLMPKKRRLALVGTALSVAIVAIIVSTIVFSMNTSSVSAQDIAEKSYQTVSTLTAEQKDDLTRTIHIVDPVKLLEEARNAQDLRMLTYDQLVDQGTEPVFYIRPESSVTDIRFLQFTNYQGMKVTLGIDPKNNLPVSTSMAYENPDGSGTKTNSGMKPEETASPESTLIVDGK